jgi:DNA (cytosine-5)-methyltransferase 1
LTRLYLERVADLRPTFFVMENVPGLLRTKKHREPFMEIIRREIWPQYDATMGIYNALDYGVPQDRERLIVVGRLKSATERGLLAPWKIPPPLFPSAKFGYPWPTEVVPAGEVPEKPDLCPEELMAGTHICGDLSGLSNGTESFRPKSDKFGTILEGDVSRKSFKKLHRFRFSPTACYGNNEVHLHPVEPRRLTVREALRLQSVPDGYALPPEMSLTDKFKMIGNGVPVRLASAVADSIAEMIG